LAYKMHSILKCCTALGAKAGSFRSEKMEGLKVKLGLLVSVLGVMLAFAGQIPAQTNGNNRQMSDNLRSLQSSLSTFRYDLNDALSRVRYRDYQGEDPSKSLQDLETAYRAFNDDFKAKRETDDGVRDLLQEAQDMDVFLKTISLGDRVNYDWSRIRSALDELASNYKVNWSWDGDNYSYSQPVGQPQQPQPQSTPQQNGSQTYGVSNTGLSGTYRLNAGDSENAGEVSERAVMIITQRDRDRIKADLADKLTPPDEITLDVRGQQVSLSSSKGAQASFIADGNDKFETASDGRNVRVRATLRGDKLTISRVGDQDDDFTVTFESTDNGKRMRVTRRVTYASMSQTVLAESMYDKTSDYGSQNSQNSQNGQNSQSGGNYPNNNTGNYPTTSNPRQGDFIVPNGTIISATLENEINTKMSQENDRFRMTVQSPNEFNGAVIEGYVTNVKRSGKLNSRATITFNFEKIRLRNGQIYEFAGFLQSFTNANGEVVKVDTEGTAKGDSQTKETAKRGGIGAGIGAIIGGVIGGVKGAVIGATIGAAGGAGSVYVQGRDDLELKQGSTVTIQATAPNR
jgi:hypothetical protein